MVTKDEEYKRATFLSIIERKFMTPHEYKNGNNTLIVKAG